MPMTTINPLTEYEKYNVGTLMFPRDFHDSSHYYDLPAIRKKYGFHSRSQVHILTQVFEDDIDYINAPANKENRQKHSTTCHEENECSIKSDMSMFCNASSSKQLYESYYPYGDVMIFGETSEELTQRKKDKEYQTRCNSIRKEINKKIKEETDEKRLAMIMNLIENFENSNAMEQCEYHHN